MNVPAGTSRSSRGAAVGADNDRANIWSSNFRAGWLQQANTGVFIVSTNSHLLDESPFRPSNADRSFIVKIRRMFDALR